MHKEPAIFPSPVHFTAAENTSLFLKLKYLTQFRLLSFEVKHVLAQTQKPDEVQLCSVSPTKCALAPKMDQETNFF